MTERSATLVQELWEEEDGRTMVCEAGPAGDPARALLAARARLAWVFEACSHFDAMTKYYARMDWGAYTTDQTWDHEPYPTEWTASLRDRNSDRLGVYVQLNKSSIVGHDRLLSPCGSAFLVSQLEA